MFGGCVRLFENTMNFKSPVELHVLEDSSATAENLRGISVVNTLLEDGYLGGMIVEFAKHPEKYFGILKRE